MQHLSRFQIKFFTRDQTIIDAAQLIPIFHRWIQQNLLDELIIDVADYRHVHHGPLMMLVGHGSDYVYDAEDGKPGLLYYRKRDFAGDPQALIRDAFKRALNACALLEKETIKENISFDTSRFCVRILDRLHAPNTAETFAAAKQLIQPVLEELYPNQSPQFEHVDDNKQPFTMNVRYDKGPSLQSLNKALA